jgi:hypothetical protein
VIALVVYRYRREIGLSFKGLGIQAKLNAKGRAEGPRDSSDGRNVLIGGDAERNRIMTGDSTAGKKSGPDGGRNVSVRGNADGNTIVTGDGNKIG